MAKAKQELTDTRVQGRQVQPAEDHLVLLPAEAAELLRVSLDQLYHLTSGKKIPFVKVGGALRFDRRRLEDFLQNGGNDQSSQGSTGRRKAGSRGSNGTTASEHTERSRFGFKTPPRPKK